jgi:hypothetical protein
VTEGTRTPDLQGHNPGAYKPRHEHPFLATGSDLQRRPLGDAARSRSLTPTAGGIPARYLTETVAFLTCSSRGPAPPKGGEKRTRSVRPDGRSGCDDERSRRQARERAGVRATVTDGAAVVGLEGYEDLLRVRALPDYRFIGAAQVRISPRDLDGLGVAIDVPDVNVESPSHLFDLPGVGGGPGVRAGGCRMSDRRLRAAAALAASEIDGLPRIDDRFGVWSRSLRDIARRRGCSPGTVQRHVQALRHAGVLVPDEHQPRQLLIDIARLTELHPTQPVTDPTTTDLGQPCRTRQVTEDLVAAIDALTCWTATATPPRNRAGW